MSDPISHHRAAGIHPGAFVGPTAPDTSDVQDGVLWVDTSIGHPYQLWVWKADPGEWTEVGLTNRDDYLYWPEGSSLQADHQLFAWLDHDSGIQLIQHTGDAFTISGVDYSPNELLTLPLPLAGSDTPTKWLGKSNTAQYPVTFDAPALITKLSPSPAGAPDSGVATNDALCGAAVNMTELLTDTYNRLSSVLNGAENIGLSLTIDAFVTPIIEGLTVGLGTPAIALLQPGIIQLANFLAAGTGLDFPSLTGDQTDSVTCAAYAAIHHLGASIELTAADLTAWQSNISAGSGYDGLQQTCLNFIIGCVALEGWQARAYRGSKVPSTVCAGCP
jgi:hypothetical protein